MLFFLITCMHTRKRNFYLTVTPHGIFWIDFRPKKKKKKNLKGFHNTYKTYINTINSLKTQHMHFKLDFFSIFFLWFTHVFWKDWGGNFELWLQYIYIIGLGGITSLYDILIYILIGDMVRSILPILICSSLIQAHLNISRGHIVSCCRVTA